MIRVRMQPECFNIIVFKSRLIASNHSQRALLLWAEVHPSPPLMKEAWLHKRLLFINPPRPFAGDEGVIWTERDQVI